METKMSEECEKLWNFGFVSGHDFSHVTCLRNGFRLHSLLKNSSFDFVLKGRGFKPRRKCYKINPALAAEANF